MHRLGCFPQKMHRQSISLNKDAPSRCFFSKKIVRHVFFLKNDDKTSGLFSKKMHSQGIFHFEVFCFSKKMLCQGIFLIKGETKRFFFRKGCTVTLFPLKMMHRHVFFEKKKSIVFLHVPRSVHPKTEKNVSWTKR